jgi:hypothetical protein
MYKNITNFLLFMLGYIILRYIIQIFYTHFTRQIDGYREYRINNLPRFGSGGANISTTVYDINLSSKYTDPYCYNNPTLCNKPL